VKEEEKGGCEDGGWRGPVAVDEERRVVVEL